MRLADVLALGIHDENLPDDPEIRERFRRVLFDGARLVARSGATVTLQDLAGFSALERELYARAARQERLRNMLDFAAAISGREAEVAAELDGGQSIIERELDEFTADLVKGLDA
tara:strand:- start:13024 stop:13368 length:345 start_codon:yes stop_codon:yes gene_type:complete